MINALRLICHIVVITFVFSIIVQGKTIFAHIYSAISPMTKLAQNAAESLFSNTFNSTSDYTKKLFDNSVPKVKDSVRSQLSAANKRGDPEEVITNQEKVELEQLIKSKK